MTRAEERALEAYPIKDYNNEPNYIHTCDTKMLDEVYRDVFRIGYEQAEKDLTLTWKDISIICQAFVDVNYEFDYHSLQEKYEEILRRFNEEKEEKK